MTSGQDVQQQFDANAFPPGTAPWDAGQLRAIASLDYFLILGRRCIQNCEKEWCANSQHSGAGWRRQGQGAKATRQSVQQWELTTFVAVGFQVVVFVHVIAHRVGGVGFIGRLGGGVLKICLGLSILAATRHRVNIGDSVGQIDNLIEYFKDIKGMHTYYSNLGLSQCHRDATTITQ